MGITFNTNLSALTSQRYLGIAGDKTASSLAKLSSGSRVPTAKDDAAALAVGSKLRAEVAGLNSAANNASQAVSLLQIADGALSTVGDILVRQKALAVQSSSGQLSDSERSLLNQEFTNLRSEIDRIAGITNFNGTSLLSGSTTVAASVNSITSAGTSVTVNGSSVGNAAENLISEGVQSISFNSDFGDGVVKFAYDAANKTATMTNLETGNSQSVTLATADIAVGATETVSFGSLGATVVLNSNFDKSVSSSATNGTRQASYVAANTSGSAITTTAGLSSISEFRLKANGTGGVVANDLNGLVFTITGAGSTAGTQSTIQSASFTGNDGASHQFSVKSSSGATGGTVDLSTTGAKTVTLIDASGNEVDLSFTVGTALANGNTATITSTVQGINSSRVDVNAGDVTFAAATVGAGNGTTPAITATVITSTSFNGLNPPLLSAIEGATAPVLGTAGTTGAPTAVGAGNITFGGKTFTTSSTGNFNSGSSAYTYEDGDGNSFVLTITTTGTFGTTSTAALGAIDLDHNPAIQNSSINLLAASKSSTSTFDFGDIDVAKVTFDTSTANSSDATLTLSDGTTFTNTAVDLTTTGVKTVTLTGNGSAAGATITFSFNLTGAVDASDSFEIDLGELGQVIGANENTGESTNFSFKVGTGVTTNDNITFALDSATTSQLGIDSSTVDTADNAELAITALNAAITTVSSQRADIGANQSRLDFAAASIAVSIENTTAAQSGLMDVDVSAEITEFTSQQVLLQAGVSLLAQANQQPSLLLRLLQ
ncbi:MAG: flagellin [Alphaproteobacteria bacterium]